MPRGPINPKLLATIRTKNTQIEHLTEEVRRLQSEVSTLRIGLESRESCAVCVVRDATGSTTGILLIPPPGIVTRVEKSD